MIASHPAWLPYGFDDWRRHYPSTPFERAPAALDWTARFIDCWHAPGAAARADTIIVLIAGLYSEWIPACFRHAARALHAARYPVLRVPVRSSRGVLEQGRHIVRALHARMPAGSRFIVLAHSKGGLDALAALHADSGLRARCDGIALVQPPVGPSAIVDGLLDRRGARIDPAWLRWTAGKLLRTRWLHAGSRDIGSGRDAGIANLLSALPGDLHCVHVVSWSVERQSRFDAHHPRLDRYRPGCAHDGQFYLDHQTIRGMPQVCMPHLDHGQPVLGGAGFDAGRFWLALVALLDATRPATAAGAQTR
ncbi:hypothetical protein WI72_13020 [Burkholderia ubonensis]|uniref:hypothetical protein n=1 Tax=Burkholderia ubonensis TaxID=101571 RepID=UPI000759E99F|nr:hypothetical protein [Burkholderia ubonensis]KVC60135.1 hypothetical protein WI72_13020 [Burkholderia ubonensis]KVD94075.1 hypothetical protein WI90_08160 [Burkholderia ubonensis]